MQVLNFPPIELFGIALSSQIEKHSLWCERGLHKQGSDGQRLIPVPSSFSSPQSLNKGCGPSTRMSTPRSLPEVIASPTSETSRTAATGDRILTGNFPHCFTISRNHLSVVTPTAITARATQTEATTTTSMETTTLVRVETTVGTETTTE